MSRLTPQPAGLVFVFGCNFRASNTSTSSITSLLPVAMTDSPNSPAPLTGWTTEQSHEDHCFKILLPETEEVERLNTFQWPYSHTRSTCCSSGDSTNTNTPSILLVAGGTMSFPPPHLSNVTLCHGGSAVSQNPTICKTRDRAVACRCESI
jgi:hypothetical protein